ncbi:DeoR/GlpR family DNA-binding transcription regulator [Ideonella sp. BN130291]|uniref:DeoR/GlpR family DNA-binding transcription regulator n=1 Tax=Ideonella sp. BN130291 TaxID=3112940 RepID=UPI002E26D358|nr:DeoR/GlpR family DNA-binding transcription regulator [Ideonella sp. BN130291]
MPPDTTTASTEDDAIQRPRFAEERRARILGWLRDHGRVEVLDLARNLGVSEHTIRRDLLELQAQGALQKTHGGAVMLDTARLGVQERSTVLPQAKQEIGRAAARHVQPGQTLILDAGTTTLAMARALTARPLTVVTNALDVATLFDRDKDVQLVLTGGTWQPAQRAFWGPAALALLAGCRADWAVPGACALDARMGVTAADESDSAVKRAMVAAAARTMILADHSKQASVAPFSVARWPEVHLLVTDRAWPEVQALGVQLEAVGGGTAA